MKIPNFAILAAGAFALAVAGCGEQLTSVAPGPGQKAPSNTNNILRGDVGDFVWFDQNDNGLQDDGAMSGVNGVDVVIECIRLLDGSLWTMTFTTANNPATGLPGWYNFNSVPAGSCMAYVDPATVPPDLMISSQPCGGPLEFAIGAGSTGNNNKTIDFCLVNTNAPIRCFDGQVAFAFGGSAATCFLSVDDDGDGTADFDRWGWTNAISPGTYTWPLFDDAIDCQRSRGHRVGTVTVDYDGSTAVVTYTMDPGRTIASTHLYIGSEILPRDGLGDFTVTPRLYPRADDFATCSDATGTQSDPFICDGPGVTSHTYTVTGLSGDVHVVAHANVLQEINCPPAR